MFNFKEIYSLLSSRGACTMVHDERELLRVLQTLGKLNYAKGEKR